MSVSYLEIYNENLRDLMVDPVTPRGQKGGEKKPASLDIRHVPGQPVHVPGLSTVLVESASEVERAIERGAARRSVTATKMNSESSRSHSLVTIEVRGRPTDCTEPPCTTGWLATSLHCAAPFLI